MSTSPLAGESGLGQTPSLKLEDHIFRIMDNQFRLLAELGACDWNLNAQTETLSFLVDGGHTVLAEVPAHLVGNLDEVDHLWEWAWANPANTNPRMVRGCQQVRRLAEAMPGAPDYLTREGEFPAPFPDFGTAMAILTAGVSRGFCFFKCPYVGGEEFVVIDRFPAAAALPDDPERTLHALQLAINTVAFDHKAAVQAYFRRPPLSGLVPLPGGRGMVRLTFENDRIVHLELANVAPTASTSSRPGFWERLFGRRN